jgi:hypothetical protein
MNETSAQKDYTWLLNIIVSCNNEFQLECIDRLNELYKLKYPDEQIDLHPQLLKQRELQSEKIKTTK